MKCFSVKKFKKGIRQGKRPKRLKVLGQCDQIWRHFPALAKFGNFLRVHLLFGIIFKILWLNFYDNTQIFFIENGQILNNNLAILSHCHLPRHQPRDCWFQVQITMATALTFSPSSRCPSSSSLKIKESRFTCRYKVSTKYTAPAFEDLSNKQNVKTIFFRCKSVPNALRTELSYLDDTA